VTGPHERPPYAGGPAERSFAPPPGGTAHTSSGGVPPRPSPLPPPRPSAPSGSAAPSGPPSRTPGRGPATRPTSSSRGRRARLTLRRIDPWSVFLWSVVASIFLGLALLVCVGVLYALLSSLGVLDSLNTLINDVTTNPGETSDASSVFSAGRVMSITAVVAALDVVLLTALATLGAFLYNLCASLTGGIEVTLGDRDG
jgi:hypothetical protein